MAFTKCLMFLVASVLGFSESAFVDTLNKCELKNKDCLNDLLQNVIKEVAKPGIPELGIPSIDPLELKNFKFNLLNAVDMTLIDGTVTGVRNCDINKFEVNTEKWHAYLDLTCDIVIQTKYALKTQGDIVKNLLGEEVHGEGNGKLEIEQINLKIDFPVQFEKRGDNIFLKEELKSFKHTFELLGKITFDADNLFLGDKESSKDIVKLLNENGKLLVGSFGNPFIDVMMALVYDFLLKFFNNVPATNYLLDDLTQYVK